MGSLAERGIADIRDYCETDVVNTYLVLCRFRLMRGELSRSEYDAELELRACATGRHRQGALGRIPGGLAGLKNYRNKLPRDRLQSAGKCL